MTVPLPQVEEIHEGDPAQVQILQWVNRVDGVVATEDGLPNILATALAAWRSGHPHTNLDVVALNVLRNGKELTCAGSKVAADTLPKLTALQVIVTWAAQDDVHVDAYTLAVRQHPAPTPDDVPPPRKPRTRR